MSEPRTTPEMLAATLRKEIPTMPPGAQLLGQSIAYYLEHDILIGQAFAMLRDEGLVEEHGGGIRVPL